MTEISSRKSVLVLGAYGLIGAHVTQHLCALGYVVTGMGRNEAVAKRVLGNLPWISEDISTLTSPEDWIKCLDRFDAVVNCSGSLQNGPDNDLDAIHHYAVKALAYACAQKNIQLVQISAVGASESATTEFLRSKGRGDRSIREVSVHYQILLPGLVIAPNAYGGTGLLRMLSAVPWIQPLALADARMQTISITDISKVVAASLDGRVPNRFEGDLVEAETHALRTVIAFTRNWLGFEPAWLEISIPTTLFRLVGRIADGLGWLGWRSPLRSTALTTLREGVVGNSDAWNDLALFPISSLPETYSKMASSNEKRLAAKMSLIMPILVFGLFLFWSVSGLIGLVFLEKAAAVLTLVGWPLWLAKFSVLFWAFIDLGLAAMIAFRKTAEMACLAMIAVSLFYLLAASLVTPFLWVDPLGPLVKIIPVILSALITFVSLETR